MFVYELNGFCITNVSSNDLWIAEKFFNGLSLENYMENFFNIQKKLHVRTTCVSSHAVKDSGVPRIYKTIETLDRSDFTVVIFRSENRAKIVKII